MACFSTGAGAFFGVGTGANMLAQLFLTPSGIMLEVALGAALAVELAAARQLSSETLALSQLAVSSCLTVSHADDSSVGIEFSECSLRVPFVWATDAPRPRPPRPRSVPRPRTPLPLSNPVRPPRDTLALLPLLVTSPRVVVMVSLTLDRARSFFAFETSPHCEIVPVLCC